MGRSKTSRAGSYLSLKALSIKKEQSWPSLWASSSPDPGSLSYGHEQFGCSVSVSSSSQHRDPTRSWNIPRSRIFPVVSPQTVSLLLLQAVWKSTWPTSTSNKRTTLKPSSCTEWHWIRSSTLTRRWGSRSCRTSGWSSSAWANTLTLLHLLSTSWVRALTLKQASTLSCATMPSATGRGWRRPFRNSSLFPWASTMKTSTSRLMWVQ